MGCGHWADMWSVGVLIYYIISAGTPFDGREVDEVLEMVKKGKWKFQGVVWDHVSHSAKVRAAL